MSSLFTIAARTLTEDIGDGLALLQQAVRPYSAFATDTYKFEGIAVLRMRRSRQTFVEKAWLRKNDDGLWDLYENEIQPRGNPTEGAYFKTRGRLMAQGLAFEEGLRLLREKESVYEAHALGKGAKFFGERFLGKHRPLNHYSRLRPAAAAPQAAKFQH